MLPLCRFWRLCGARRSGWSRGGWSWCGASRWRGSTSSHSSTDSPGREFRAWGLGWMMNWWLRSFWGLCFCDSTLENWLLGAFESRLLIWLESWIFIWLKSQIDRSWFDWVLTCGQPQEFMLRNNNTKVMASCSVRRRKIDPPMRAKHLSWPI